MKRYRIKLIKYYTFDLDDKSKEGVKEQIDYILTETNLLEMPYIKKDVKIKIKQVKRKKWRKK